MHIGMKLDSTYLSDPNYRRIFCRDGSPLEQLKKCGLEFVEFPIQSDFKESFFENLVDGCRRNGLGVTLHPYLNGIFNSAAFEEDPENPCLVLVSRCLRFAHKVAKEQGHPLPVVFHGASNARLSGLPWAKESREFYFEKSRRFFVWMMEYVEREKLLVAPMAELQLAPRADQPFIRIGDNYPELLDMIRGIPISICWDMGHAMMNHLRAGRPIDPPQEFVDKVRHVHLHDILNAKDHQPLIYGGTPYQRYLGMIKAAGFDGYINLEMSSEGLLKAGPFEDVMTQSVENFWKAWNA